MAYGVGQGLNEGVKTAGNFLLDAMRRKQYDRQLDQENKRYYDSLAVQLGWKQGWNGEEDAASAGASAMLPAVPQEGAPGSSATMPEPRQVGRLSVPGSPVRSAGPLRPLPSSAGELLSFPMGPPRLGSLRGVGFRRGVRGF